VHAKFLVQRANGQTEVIHDRPFNFEEQTTWPVDFVVRNGDRITTTCVYTNPGGRSVRFGTSTDDEMCFNFSLYYPMCAMTCTQSDPVAQAWSSSQGGGCPQGASSGGLFGN
jgi:Copper type II ascorbate-dependent monooxygenase, C-terminal domain